MQVNLKVIEIVNKVLDGYLLSKDEIIYLLKIPLNSVDAGYIMSYANVINRAASKGKAEIHAQIGVNLSPCPNNCSFCSFADSNKIFKKRLELDIEEVVQLALKAEREGANAIFFMTTADYPFSKFIEMSYRVRDELKPNTVMVANIGDFNYEEAEQLKEAGYKGIYHAVRLGEGTYTKIKPETRLNTMRAASDVGLLVGTCVEPVGPEHSIDEIAEKIIIGREVKPCFSGAMRRINIQGSTLEKYGMISEYRLAFLVAIVRLAMGKDLVGNCTHEPNILGATSGANLFWAEVGANPRDTKTETSKGRGLDIKSCIELFNNADFDVLQGPSVIYNS